MKAASRRAAPQAGVKLTMEACCIMFSVKPEMEKNPDGACRSVPRFVTIHA